MCTSEEGRMAHFSNSSWVMLDSEVWSMDSMNETAPICGVSEQGFQWMDFVPTRLER